MCDKRVSTKNGVLTCDIEGSHVGYHHATHPGGLAAYPDQRHDGTNTSPLRNEKGECLAVHLVEPLEIEWAQEPQPEPIRFGADTAAAKARATKPAAGGP